MKNVLYCFLIPLITLWGSIGATAAPGAGPDGVVLQGPNQVCKGEQATYSIYSPNPNYTYSFIVPSGGTILSTTATTAIVLWTSSPSGTVMATAFDGPNFYDDATMTVTISDRPDPFITSAVSVGCASQILDEEDPDPQDDSRCFVVCQGSQVVFTANGNPGSSFTWNATGGSIVATTATTATVQFNSVGFGQITLTETTSNGCKETEIRCVEVIEKPNADFTIIPEEVFNSGQTCVLRELNFIDLSTAGNGSPIVSWQWDFGDGSYSNDPDPSHTYTSTGNYNITLTVENECHCTDVMSFEIEVLEAEPLNVECPSVVCEGQEVIYTVTNDGCEDYEWQVLGGFISSGDPNSNQVGITWSNEDGGEYNSGFGYITVRSLCGDECPTSLKVPIIRSVGTIEGPQQLCEGEEYLYRLPRWPATDFTWSITGNGQVYSTDQPNEIAVVPGVGATNLTLRCTYTNDLVGCGGKASIDLNVVPPATFDGPEEACINVASTYTLSGSFSGSWVLRKQNGTVAATGSGHSFSPTFTTTGTHLLYVSGSSFCSPEPLEIEVLPKPPVVNQINGPDEVCTGIPYSFTAQNSIPGTTLNWSVTGGSFSGPGSTVSGERATITFSGAGPFQVQVWRQYQADLGCQSANLVKNISKKQVVLNIDGEQTVCANTYQDYFASYTDGDVYEWSISPETMGSVVAGDGSGEVTILWNDLATTATATLEVKMRVCNTVYTETIPVDVNPSATITLNGPASKCGGQSALFDVPGSQVSSFSSVDWDFGDGTTTTTTGLGALSTSHVFPSSPSGNLSFTVQVTVNDANGCVKPARASHVINIDPTPEASITPAANQTQCTNTPFSQTLTAAIPTGGASFQWYRNGSAISGATSSTYLVSGTGSGVLGTYHCRVTKGGCYDNSNAVVFSYKTCGGSSCDVEGDPNIVLSNVTISGCGEISVDLTNNVSGSSNPRWSPAPVSSSGNTYTFSFNQTGQHTIKFLVDVPDGMGGVCVHSNAVQEVVPYRADLKYTVQCGPAGKYTVNLLDNSNYYPGYAITDYSFTINGATHSGSSPSYQEDLVPGTYPVQLIIDDGTSLPNCTINDVIDLPALPVANFSFDPNATCEGFPIQFVNTSTPATGLEYEWDFTDGAKVKVKNPSRVFAAAGSYPVKLTVINELGCSSTTQQTVTVVDNTLNGTVMPGNSVVCGGTPLTLTYSNPTGGIPDNYYWQPDSFAIVSHPDNSTTVIESGSYFVTVTDANKCTFSTQNVSVEFVPVPEAVITGPTDVCLGEDIKLYGDAGAGNYDYEWTLVSGSPGSIPSAIDDDPNITLTTGPGGDFSPTGTTPVTYTFQLKVSITNPIPCNNTETFQVTVHPAPAQPDFDIPIDAVQCTPYEVQLVVDNPDPTGTYTWSDGQSGNTIYVNKGGEYTLTYTNEFGCTSSVTKRVDKSPWEYIWIYPLGCYEQCPEFQDQLYDIPDPIIEFDAWAVEKNGNPFLSNSTSPELPDAKWLSVYGSNLYSYSLSLNGCTATSEYSDVTVLEECCRLEVDAGHMDYIDEGEGCRNEIQMYFGNPSGQPITISLSSDLGVFVPNTITIPPGGGSYTFQFFPYSGVAAGAMGNFKAVSEYYEDPENKVRCIYEGELQLPNPMCDATMWKRAIAGTGDEEGGETVAGLFQLAPNPATSQVSVIYELPQWTETSTGSLEVHDLRGARVAEYPITRGEGTELVQITNWTASVYIIILRVDGEVKDYRRLVIQ